MELYSTKLDDALASFSSLVIKLCGALHSLTGSHPSFLSLVFNEGP